MGQFDESDIWVFKYNVLKQCMIPGHIQASDIMRLKNKIFNIQGKIKILLGGIDHI